MFQGFKSLFERKSVEPVAAVEAKADEPAAMSFDELAELLTGGRATVAGVPVGPEFALRCSPAFGCVRVIAETVQEVPAHLYRRLPDNGRERADAHPAARVLASPNPWTTGSELKLLIGMHLATFGNAYCWLGRDADGNPAELIILDPRQVSIKADDATMEPAYVATTSSGTQREYRRDEILHVRGPGLDVYKGAAPVELAREAIGLALTLENNCAGLYGRGAKPSGMLKVKGRKDATALARIRALFSQFYSGGSNAGKTMILDDDMSFEQVQMSSVDAQLLEMRKHQITEISRFWRVPLSLLNELSEVKYATAEAMAMQFVQFVMLPVFRSISDALALTLLKPEERDEFFFDWTVDDFVRADLAARMSAYATAVSHGILSPDECRAMDNRGPVPDGSGAIFTRPVNAAPVATSNQTEASRAA